MSDTFPIYGRARSPYIVIASCAGVVGFLLLASEFTTSTLGIGSLLLLTSFAQSVPDVMVDASVTERIKVFPEYATDLQVTTRPPCTECTPPPLLHLRDSLERKQPNTRSWASASH
jgi:hypothetical protein